MNIIIIEWIIEWIIELNIEWFELLKYIEHSTQMNIIIIELIIFTIEFEGSRRAR